MKYRTIVADPPWEVKAGPGWNSNGRSRDLIYPTMSIKEIRDMDISDVAEPDAHLYIWTINKYIPETYEIAKSWGFKPSTLLVWCKKPHGIGLGGTFVLCTEYVLFCRRGNLKSMKRIDVNWWLWKRGKHSQKPEDFQGMIEQISPAPRLELFARRKRQGWDVWGNEVESDIKMVA